MERASPKGLGPDNLAIGLSQVEGFRENLRLDAILLGLRKSGQRLDKLLTPAGDNAVHQVAVQVVEPGRAQEVKHGVVE